VQGDLRNNDVVSLLELVKELVEYCKEQNDLNPFRVQMVIDDQGNIEKYC
jgi:hypothetical protein